LKQAGTMFSQIKSSSYDINISRVLIYWKFLIRRRAWIYWRYLWTRENDSLWGRLFSQHSETQCSSLISITLPTHADQ